MERVNQRIVVLAVVAAVIGALAFAMPTTHADHVLDDAEPDMGGGNGTLPSASDLWMRWVDENRGDNGTAGNGSDAGQARTVPYDYAAIRAELAVLQNSVADLSASISAIQAQLAELQARLDSAVHAQPAANATAAAPAQNDTTAATAPGTAPLQQYKLAYHASIHRSGWSDTLDGTPVFVDTVTCSAPIQVTGMWVEVPKDDAEMREIAASMCRSSAEPNASAFSSTICESFTFGLIKDGFPRILADIDDLRGQEHLPARLHAIAGVIPYVNGTLATDITDQLRVGLANGTNVTFTAMHPAADMVSVRGIVFGGPPLVALTYDAPAGTECTATAFDSTTLPGDYTEASDAMANNNTTVLLARGSSVPGCEENNACHIPYTVKVDAGGTVVWENIDNAAHTVASGVLADGGPDGVFDSGLIPPDSTFSHGFHDPGEYPYFCLLHPWASGMVIVE